MKFELRLHGGPLFFMSTIRPRVSGGLRAVHTPEFCHGAEGSVPCRDGTRGAWEVWPMAQLPHSGLLTEPMCRPVDIAENTPGIGFLGFFPDEKYPGQGLALQIFLSTTLHSAAGPSVLDDWVRILGETKDDLNRDTILRMNLGAVTEAEAQGFRSRKTFASTDLELDVRPRPVQWAPDD